MSTVQTTPPRPSAPHVPILPTPLERRLANGLRVIAFQQRTGPKALGVPLIAAQLLVRGGGSSDGDTAAGLSQLMASLLTTGTTSRTAFQIAEAVDALGARLDASSGYDAQVVSVSATTPVFADAFALMGDVALHPAFAQSEVDRVCTKAIGDLGLTYSNPSSLARLTANRVAYAATPYGHPLSGTAETLAAITRADVVAFHARWFRPDNAVLVIGGDVAPDDAFALADATFGDWYAPAEPLVPVAVFAPPAARARIVAIDKPDAGRTAVLVGRTAIARHASAYSTGIVTTAVLSGYSGRLNQEIRVKRGLSYGAGAQLVARRAGGLFLASTLVDHTKAVETVNVMHATLAGLAQAPVGAAELTPRVATITGGFSRGIETIDGIVGTLGELALYDVPLDDLAAYVPRIEAVSSADIQTFAQTYIGGDTFVVLVGDAAKFADVLANATVIPVADLDLNHAI